QGSTLVMSGFTVIPRITPRPPIAVWIVTEPWAVSQSFHPARRSPTGAHWLDDAPDVTCEDRTARQVVDGQAPTCKQQVGGSSPGSAPASAGSEICRPCLACLVVIPGVTDSWWE